MHSILGVFILMSEAVTFFLKLILHNNYYTKIIVGNHTRTVEVYMLVPTSAISNFLKTIVVYKNSSMVALSRSLSLFYCT